MDGRFESCGDWKHQIVAEKFFVVNDYCPNKVQGYMRNGGRLRVVFREQIVILDNVISKLKKLPIARDGMWRI